MLHEMLSLALPTFRDQLTFHRDYCCGWDSRILCNVLVPRWGERVGIGVAFGAGRFYFLILNCKCKPIVQRPEQFRRPAFLLARLFVLLWVKLVALEITKSSRLTKPRARPRY